MTSQNLEQTLHLNDHSIVENVIAAVHIFSRFLLKGTSSVLLDLFAALVLCFTVLLQNGVDGLFDSLLVPFLSDLHDLANDNILQSIL